MENNIKLLYDKGVDKETRDWFNYARIVSKRNNFNVVYEACFIYYVTMYLADEGISAGAEEEYFLKRLDKKVEEIYSTSKTKTDEIYQKVYFFNSLTDFFNSDEIKEYEKHIFQHNIRVSAEIKEWFTEKGVVRDTIKNLLFNVIPKPHLNMNAPSSDSIVFLLTYSEETVWRNLSRVDDPDRLRILLF